MSDVWRGGSCTGTRVNRSIKKALICEFIDKKLNFHIEIALKYVVDNYNNNYHNTIKFSPAKVFFSEDEELFIKVKENTLNSSKNYDINLSLFKKK